MSALGLGACVWVAVLLASSEQEVAALVRMERHVPLRFPLLQMLEVLL